MLNTYHGHGLSKTRYSRQVIIGEHLAKTVRARILYIFSKKGLVYATKYITVVVGERHQIQAGFIPSLPINISNALPVSITLNDYRSNEPVKKRAPSYLW